MKTNVSKRIVALLLTLVMVLSLVPVVFAGEVRDVEQDLVGKTVILHTNDTHGALLGFAQVAKVKKDFEARGAKVILVDAGDFSQGTTYVSTSKGETAITVMDAAGYDYVTLGNHEFDFGYAQLKANLDKTEKFRAICADVLLKADGSPAFAPYAIETVDGMTIGIFGMETPETLTKVNPGLIQEITFPQGEELYAIAQAQVNALRNEEHADLVIGLVHLGVDDESIPNRSIDLYEHVTGIDFLIDGHSHTVMTEGPNGEPIQSTGTKASKNALMNVGVIVIDNATKTIESHDLIPLGEDAEVEPTTAAVARSIMNEVDAVYGAKFAESQVELNGNKAPGNRNMETNLGDLITDSMRWGVLKDLDAETLGVPADNVVAITNGGGIRAWIHVGDVTRNDVNSVLPFGNTVAVVYVKGSELLEALEASTYSTPGAVGGFPQVSGMKYEINTRVPFDKGEQYPDSTYYKPASIQRVTIQEINGKAFDENATYAVVTNNFCSAGGDTYYAFKAASSQFDTGIPMDEMLMDYIGTELGGVIGETYAEPQGRITQPFLFDDVKDPTVWYFKHVYWALENGITSGTTATTFSPDAGCTRAQVATFLYAAAGKPEFQMPTETFTDVNEGDWYYKPVMWALSQGITSGMGDGTFGANSTCTRAQIATFLYAAAGKPAFEMPTETFTDVNEGDWYYKAVMWARANEITAGMGDGTFGANSTCTRAQIVTFLHKAVDVLGNHDEEITFPSTSNEDIEKYGNIFTNITATDFAALGFTWGDIVTVKFLDKELDLPVVPNYSYVDQGTPLLYLGKDGDNVEPEGRVKMAINMGNFATTYGLATKTVNEDKTYYWTACEGVQFPVPVTIEMKEQGGYLTEMEIRDINRTNNREDYPRLTDEEFANFRRIATTGMGDHLYRGSSPIDPELGRNGYADTALRNAGVTVIMNLANSQAEAEAFQGYASTYYAGQKIVFLNLGVDFQADEFKASLATGLRYFANNKGVYYVHCKEGKDRAGFVSALLECLMGATYDEVVNDYLKTYRNYYNVVNGQQQPLSEETLTVIANSNIVKTLQVAFGVEDLKTADLAAKAEAYISGIGLTAEEIANLKANLAGAYEEEPGEQPIGKALGNYSTANYATQPSTFMDLIHTVQIWGAYDRSGATSSGADNEPATLSIVSPLLPAEGAEYYLTEGDIYLEDIDALYPENAKSWLYQIEMTGEELKAWIEFSATLIKEDENGFFIPPYSLKNYDTVMGDGFRYQIDMTKPVGERVSMLYNNQPVLANQKFTVVINDARCNSTAPVVNWMNDHGCSDFDPEENVIYSTETDMANGETEGCVRALLISYIREQTAANGGIRPTYKSDWTIMKSPRFVKLTAAPEDWTNGTYILVYELDGANGKVFNGTDAAEGGSYQTVTINEGVIDYDEDLFTVNFEEMEGGFAIWTNNGYMGNTTDGNGVVTNHEDPILNTLSFDENGLLLTSNSKCFRFNTAAGNDRFRYFKQNASNNNLPIPAVYLLVDLQEEIEKNPV